MAIYSLIPKIPYQKKKQKKLNKISKTDIFFFQSN